MSLTLATLGAAATKAAPIVSGLGTLASGIGSLFGRNKNIDKQIKAQQEENEKNRQWNLSLAKQQNQWNIEQWNRENAYNDPSAQMSRLRNAGLNPDLMYSNGVSGLTAASSPDMTSGAPSSPVDMSALGSKATIGEMYQSIQQAMLNDEVINKTKQEGRKTGFEANSASVEALYKAARSEQELKIGDTTISLNKSVVDLNRVDADKAAVEINKVAEETNLLVARRHEILAAIENMDAKTAQTKLETYLASKEFELLVKKTTAEINNLNASTHLTYTQAKDVVATQLARISNLNASAYLSKQTGILNHEKQTTEILTQMGLNITNESASFNLSQDKKYSGIERSSKVAFTMAAALNQAAGAFTSFITKGVFGSKAPTEPPIANPYNRQSSRF